MVRVIEKDQSDDIHIYYADSGVAVIAIRSGLASTRLLAALRLALGGLVVYSGTERFERLGQRAVAEAVDQEVQFPADLGAAQIAPYPHS